MALSCYRDKTVPSMEYQLRSFSWDQLTSDRNQLRIRILRTSRNTKAMRGTDGTEPPNQMVGYGVLGTMLCDHGGGRPVSRQPERGMSRVLE